MVIASALNHPATTRCSLIHSMENSTPLTQVFCGAAQNDLQAQARAHRLGQTRTVMIYRCAARHPCTAWLKNLVVGGKT